jgi:hypothetical protein
MAVTNAQMVDVVERLSRDLRISGYASYVHMVQRFADHTHEYIDDPTYYVERVVEDVQNFILDDVITWPVCPHHPQHPLWYHDGAWVCEKDRLVVAPLGELPASGRE